MSFISIKEASEIASVSEATIRNWIKTGYLQKESNGKILKNSLSKFLTEIAGKEKLTKRANKSKKDSHNEEKLKEWLNNELQNNTNIEQIAVEYEKRLSDSFKNREGVYYTPEHIIEDMFKNIKIDKNSTFLDPACGSGNFIIKAIEKGIKPENIYGFDIDENAIEITKQRIYKKTGYKTDNIKQIDFLEYALLSNNLPKYDLIFTNPPWGKKINRNKKLKYKKILNIENSLDTTALFLFASLKLLKKDAILGFLVQDALFNIASFEDIRKRLLNYNILRIVDYKKPFQKLLSKAVAIIVQNSNKDDVVKCEIENNSEYISKKVFKSNPKTIFNFWIKNEDILVIDSLFQKPYTTLKNKAKWGIGIVTGNNKKYCHPNPKPGYIPVYKGIDISPNYLKTPSCYIPNDFSLYQQVAPLELYQAKEKLIYRFISSQLIFYYDNKQRFILNSANLLIPSKTLGVTPKQLASLLNSKIINWLFQKIFNTHKILKSDLEELPIHIQFFKENQKFNEQKYLKFLKIKELSNGTYRVEK